MEGHEGDRLEIKSNKTIVGMRPGTQLKAPIHIKAASNVIVRNIVIRGPGSNDDQAWDNLNIEGSSKNVWMDHCEFWDGQDGNADVVKGADAVTFTWSIFGYGKTGHHNLSNLVASSDDEPESEGKLNITLMFNWWTRPPNASLAAATATSTWSTTFTRPTVMGASKLGVTNGFSCNVLTENNHFIARTAPSTRATRPAAGRTKRVGNLFEGTAAATPRARHRLHAALRILVPVGARRIRSRRWCRRSAGAKLASPTSCD